MQGKTVCKAVAMLGATALLATTAQAQVNDKPWTENWAPTEWGPDDKVGSPNRTTPAMGLWCACCGVPSKIAAITERHTTATMIMVVRILSSRLSRIPLDNARHLQSSMW